MSDLDDLKRRILTKVDLAALIGESVALARKAGHLVGCCPFHAEKTGSFYVYPDHYYCYGCKEHGDAISYVRRREGMGFIEALRWLAEKHGIEAPELNEARGRLGQQRQDSQLFKMMLDAQEFYGANLQGEAGSEALAYLTGRGFTPESIKAFGFGLTPVEGYGLVRHLRAMGHGEADMIDCSLASASTRDGRPFDFLRNRVTLPIHDAQGRIIGFGGRTLDGSQPKYLNSRETKLFDKSRTLFGFDKARKVMRERGRAIVVEGYMDALQLWQAGFPETVACLGTAFTEAQMKLLQHATSVVVLLFDGDTAGQKATLASVSVALTVAEMRVRAVALTGGDDPDSFVKKNGAPALAALLDQSVDLLDFAIREKVKTTHALGLPDLVSHEFVPWLSRVADAVERGFLVNRVAQHTGIPAAVIESQLRGAAGQVADQARAARAAALGLGSGAPGRHGAEAESPLPPLTLDRVAHDFFGHVFHSTAGELDPEALGATAREGLELAPEHGALMDEMIACLAAGEAPAARAVGDWTVALDPRIAALLERLAAAAPAFACKDRVAMLAKLQRELRRVGLKASVSRWKNEMTRAAANPDRRAELDAILRTITDLTKALQALERSEGKPA